MNTGVRDLGRERAAARSRWVHFLGSQIVRRVDAASPMVPPMANLNLTPGRAADRHDEGGSGRRDPSRGHRGRTASRGRCSRPWPLDHPVTITRPIPPREVAGDHFGAHVQCLVSAHPTRGRRQSHAGTPVSAPNHTESRLLASPPTLRGPNRHLSPISFSLVGANGATSLTSKPLQTLTIVIRGKIEGLRSGPSPN
jgi:hypothetical protein